jgi:hypothetical protein
MSSNLQLPVQSFKFFTWTLRFALEPWLTQSISLNEPTYNPYSTLAILWLKEQSYSKKKCLILKNIWTMRCRNSRENRCNWFNTLGVMRKWLYIENCVEEIFLAKNNMLNQLSNCVNQFRQLKDKSEGYEDWYVSDKIWIESYSPRWRLTRFYIIWPDSTKFEEFLWYDSNYFESIKSDMIQNNLTRFNQG